MKDGEFVKFHYVDFIGTREKVNVYLEGEEGLIVRLVFEMGDLVRLCSQVGDVVSIVRKEVEGGGYPRGEG